MKWLDLVFQEAVRLGRRASESIPLQQQGGFFLCQALWLWAAELVAPESTTS